MAGSCRTVSRGGVGARVAGGAQGLAGSELPWVYPGSFTPAASLARPLLSGSSVLPLTAVSSHLKSPGCRPRWLKMGISVQSFTPHLQLKSSALLTDTEKFLELC